MICSLNEIGLTLRKAALGSGFPVGLADDIAAAGVWLCTRHLDGVGSALDAIASGFETDREWEADGAVLRAGDAAVGRWGTSLFELLVAEDYELVVVNGADAPMLMIGLAGIAAGATGTGFRLSVEHGEHAVVTARTVSGAEAFARDRRSRIDIALDIIALVAVADDPELAAWGPPRGVEVSEHHWSAAMELAARTSVPATEESRRRGAGAGLDDND